MRPLWQPTEAQKQKANTTAFMREVNKKFGKSFETYNELYEWSVNNLADFWQAVWTFVEIKYSRPYDSVLINTGRMDECKWFPGATLNFAENLLRYKDSRTAIIFKGENQKTARITYTELYEMVTGLASSLRQMGIKPGDRIAGYMPNMIETVAAMLATTAVGAVWSSCATDIGPDAAIDRLGQIGPVVLFTTDGYFYKGKPFDSLANVARIVKGIPTLKKVIVTLYKDLNTDITVIPDSITFQQFMMEGIQSDFNFEQLPFEHPAVVMFSSGTTGKPKCMVLSAGGILINHLKELIIMSDLRREDIMLYITTCSWMMWNWLVSGLATGGTIVLYDGNPLYPDEGAMWKLAQDEKITFFGLSATYVNYLKSLGFKPAEKYDLSSLREISQTGSPLSADGFEYVYNTVKRDLHFNSISGGTDINGCFVIGSPIQPVYAGELQGPGLGMKIKCYDENGKPVIDKIGELVCEAPVPSMPLYFWNDPDREKYKNAYYNVYPGVWRHGDYVLFHGDTGGITFYGRSDAVLKPSGVRIGTAEIYNQLERIEEIADSVVVGQDWQGDQRIILFVKMKTGHILTDDLKMKIVKTLRDNASPRHVPAKIFEVADIPYTFSGKKVETAVTNIVNGRPVTNIGALQNPESLKLYKDISELNN
jgi:acetoacetyl-CoA synthetase